MEEKNAVQALAECQSSEDANTLFENQDNPKKFVALHTSQGNFIRVSEGYLKHTGYSEKEIVGESAYSFFHADDMKDILKSHASITLKPEISTVEYRIRKADGSYTPVRTHSKQIPSDTGNGMIVTITEALE